MSASKQSLEKNRARIFLASLETSRYAITALIEFLSRGVLADADSNTIDQLVAQLGGGDAHLIEVLDDALETLSLERGNYVREVELDLGDSTYKVKSQ
ncbi:MAG TPA: hypothetical protein VFA21_20360 [Pyrinomonadaceae bacterium]|jgi:hypothetical protein|nr:hypothetical protein [Pyrinomonadaceae bacterium]